MSTDIGLLLGWVPFLSLSLPCFAAAAAAAPASIPGYIPRMFSTDDEGLATINVNSSSISWERRRLTTALRLTSPPLLRFFSCLSALSVFGVSQGCA